MDEMDQKDVPLVKGVVLIGFIDSVKGLPQGEALLKEIISALPEQSAKVVGGMIVAIAEYPYKVFVDCLKAAVEVSGKGDLEKAKDFGKYRSSMVIRAFLKNSGNRLSIHDLMLVGDLLWKSHHINSGYLKLEDSSPENSILRIYEFPQMDPVHCKYMEGYLGQAMEEVGAVWIEELREVKCCSRGDNYHEFRGTWKIKQEIEA
jgi:hypothetical protein